MPGWGWGSTRCLLRGMVAANGQGWWCYFLCVDKESNQRKPPPLFPSLENEGGGAHPWARSLVELFFSPLGTNGANVPLRLLMQEWPGYFGEIDRDIT